VAFHPNTERLISAWRARRGERRLPARADLSPIDLGPLLLPQVFMLGREGDREVFRLSGGLICDLYGRDLRGTEFTGLWRASEQRLIADAIARARHAAAPIVLNADAEAPSGDQIGVEICLAPLTGPGGAADRTLGLLQPTSMVGRLLGQRVRTLSLRGAALAVDPKGGPTIRLVAVNGRRLA
jgi:hypothetical protein